MTIKNYWDQAILKFRYNFDLYKKYYFLFILISIIDASADYFLPKFLENIKLAINLGVFAATIVVSILFFRELKKDKKEGDFVYLFVPFLLYSIYYSIIALLGLPLFFIPGILFYYLPLIASFTDKVSPFKASIYMARKNFKLSAFLALGALGLELLPFLIKLIPDETISYVVNMLMSFFDTLFYMLLMMMTIQYYYESIESSDFKEHFKLSE